MCKIKFIKVLIPNHFLSFLAFLSFLSSFLAALTTLTTFLSALLPVAELTLVALGF
jgi:hypothetical protein